jgi:hypothetical protein
MKSARCSAPLLSTFASAFSLQRWPYICQTAAQLTWGMFVGAVPTFAQCLGVATFPSPWLPLPLPLRFFLEMLF